MILANVWLDRDSLREQLKDCSAAFDRQQEQLDRNAEQIAKLRDELAKKENTGTTHWNGTTHYAGCIQAGPKHYECALQEIGRLRLTITHLRAELEKKAAGTYEDGYENGYQAGMAEIEAAAHTDHPLRHYDRTCPACNPKKEWVGLTDEEAAECWSTSAVKTWKNIEAKLREKNGG